MTSQNKNDTILGVSGTIIVILLSVIGYLIQDDRTCFRKALDANTDSNVELKTAVSEFRIMLEKESELATNDREGMKMDIVENSKGIRVAGEHIEALQGDIIKVKFKLHIE